MLTEWNLTNTSGLTAEQQPGENYTSPTYLPMRATRIGIRFIVEMSSFITFTWRSRKRNPEAYNLYGERRVRLRRDLRTFEIQFLDLFRVGKRRLLVDLFKLASGDLMATLRRPVEIPCEHCQFSERLAHPCPSPLFCLLPDGKRSCRDSSSGQQTL